MCMGKAKIKDTKDRFIEITLVCQSSGPLVLRSLHSAAAVLSQREARSLQIRSLAFVRERKTILFFFDVVFVLRRTAKLVLPGEKRHS